MNPSQAASDADRTNANEHTKTLASRKVDKKNTPTITIMQRLHEMDVTGYILSKKSETVKHICLPAELTDNVKPAALRKQYKGGLLDPVRLSKEVLAEQLIDLGSRGYAGQFEQTPTSDRGNIVQEEWFRKISMADFMAIRFKEPMHFFLDTAYDEKKKKTDNDPSGILAACKIKNSVYLFDAQKAYKTLPDLLRFLPEYVKGHLYSSQSTLRIEPKANGVSVVHMLEEISSLNVTKTPSPTDSKEVRLHAVSPKIECGRVYIVDGSWNEAFIDEVCGFPTKTHDEYVDILGYAINYLLGEDEDEDYDNLDKSMFGL